LCKRVRFMLQPPQEAENTLTASLSSNTKRPVPGHAALTVLDADATEPRHPVVRMSCNAAAVLQTDWWSHSRPG
jgi:hypothetical protein